MSSPAPLRPAATIVLLREGEAGPEVWLMERNRSIAFMASAWVFPGGRVDEGDAALPAITEPPAALADEIPRAFWTAAARELEEEAGVRMGGPEGYDLARLRVWAHWLTPEVEPRRFDTWFFVARLPEGAEPVIDGGEAVDGRWYRPADAIALAMEGRLPVAPPTLRTLYEIEPYATVDAILGAERRHPPVCPRFVQADDTMYVVLPGDPEHPSTERVDPPFRYVFHHGRWWAKDGPHRRPT